VEQVFKFEELPLAYEKVVKGHLRGKIVVQMTNEHEQNRKDEFGK